MIDVLFVFVSLYGLPETLSMKGLTLNCMDRKSEAYELVRLGLKVRVFPRFITLILLVTPIVFEAQFLHCFEHRMT